MAEVIESAEAATIFLVDDDPDIRRWTARMLQDYHVLEAFSGADARALLGIYKGRIDLLITDVIMPGIGGPDVAALVRSRHSGVKTLYVTGYSGDHPALAEAMAEGPVLHKPFSRADLRDAVRTLLRSSSQEATA